MNNIKQIPTIRDCEGCLGSFSIVKCEELRDRAIELKLPSCKDGFIYVKGEDSE